METNQSFFKKYGLLLSTVLLLGTMVTLFFFRGIGKDKDIPKNDGKWHGYKITADELTEYFDNEGNPKDGYTKIVFAVRISDLANPVTSLDLFRSSAKGMADLKGFVAVDMADTSANPRELILPDSEITLDKLKLLFFVDIGGGRFEWNRNFAYLLLMPKDCRKFPGHLALSYYAVAKDGTIMNRGKAEAQSNPTPPGRPE